MSFQAERVVVPVDFSGESPNAIHAALDTVGGDPSKLSLVHVLLPLDAVSPGVLLGDVSDESRTKSVTKHMQELLEENGAVGATITVLIGTPGTEIAEFAETEGADLIVIPSHGYHGFKHLLLGSVAERVIQHAKCSVLVLRRSDAK